MAVTATHLGAAGVGTTQPSWPITTVADLPAGMAAFIVAYVGSTGTVTATDTAGNTWVALSALTDTETTNRIVVLYCEETLFMASGGTITVASTTTTRFALSAAYFDGLDTSSLFDAQVSAGNGFTSTTSTTSLATPTPSQAASLVIGTTGLNSGFGDTFTQPSGYTALTKGGTTGENGIFWGWKELTGAAAETYGPGTTNNARTGLAGAHIFKVAPPANAARSMMLMGVG